ncbi:hypothetical protein TWF694_006204 [Orbilia ellipsospora]|uniref:Uncharacterized protein n=1 Tax=Orbilia ellipsospora TaxID=2528407 RepID=A0AAV9XL36_9PEZI
MLHPKALIFVFTLLLPTLITASCNADNCLRALRRYSPAALTFCSQFLATTSHTAIALPSYVSQYPSSRVSSGCLCLSTASSSSKTATPTSTYATEASPSSFTGTAVQAFSSPASCYSLSTPAASLAFVSTNLTVSTDLRGPIGVYMDQNRTTAYYFGLTVNGTDYIYDLSNLNQIAITSSTGQSLVINATGIYIFGADCHGAVAITIANFFDQIDIFANSTSSQRGPTCTV